MDAADWDARYTDSELVWGAPPNRYVVEHTTALPMGRALDLACGEGRNALWLATRGWQVTGLDYSAVALGAWVGNGLLGSTAQRSGSEALMC